jgi:hypothetical protein
MFLVFIKPLLSFPMKKVIVALSLLAFMTLTASPVLVSAKNETTQVKNDDKKNDDKKKGKKKKNKKGCCSKDSKSSCVAKKAA